MAAPSGVLFQDPRVKPLSATGQFMPGCQYLFFLSQTDTEAPVYADGELTAPISQPVTAASDGRFPPIYMDPSIVYRAQLFNNAGVQLEDTDPYVPLATIPQSAPLTLSFVTNGITRATVDQDGRWIFNPPDITGQSGITIDGITGNNALIINAGPGTGASFGLQINGGTNASDYALDVNKANGTSSILTAYGNGETLIQAPTDVTNALAGRTSGFNQVGYLDAAPTTRNSSASFALTDRGISVCRTGGVGPFTWTIPANATVGFPLGTVVLLIGLPGVTGATSLVPAAGVTLNWPQGNTTGTRTLSTTGFMAMIHQTLTNIWTISGAGVS